MCEFERSRMNSSNRNTVDYFKRRKDDSKSDKDYEEEMLLEGTNNGGSTLEIEDLLESANCNTTISIE